jgi:prepilin-type N-terminal cleavage/methylation domain-containing protein
MKKLSKAFTLVELIIVIGILAILATIAFVSFSNYTVSSRDTKRIVTIESIAK